MTAALVFVAVFTLAWVMTGAMRRYALRRGLLDAPNERSSHTVITPRGGGVAFVVAFALGFGALALDSGTLSAQAIAALAGAGAWIALVGFLDDHGHIAARWRLAAHFLGAAWALAWIGGLPSLTFLGITVGPGWMPAVFAAFFLVWMLNLYNFMDGIDGIAGIEAVTVALSGAALWWSTTHSPSALVPGLLACSVAGFLLWNFPPARIFMGDAGSGFLGFALGFFAIWSAHDDERLFWCWVILLGVFVVDATVTLVRRLARRERVYEAHRSHAYQYAARRFAQHRVVSLAVGAINLAWLLPLAALVARGRLDGMVATLVAYAPLVMLAFYFRAGAKELQG